MSSSKEASAEKQMQLRIVNLSHLVWEKKLFQRPQQLMSHFAAMGDEVSYFALVGLRRFLVMDMTERTLKTDNGLTAYNLPYMPLSKRFEFAQKITKSLLCAKARPALGAKGDAPRILWIQNPAFVDQIDQLPHDLVVYDIMDPFAAFKTSDKRVADREERILRKADLVFTGGRSLHSQVEGRHPDIHCFPSGIDFDHFAKAASDGPIPSDLKDIAKPVLGYFGAVDERIDWDLVQYLCRERRNWSVVFLGPLVLIDKIPIDEPNFHWLGPKNYDRLPNYLRGFDVCLIPWLVNDLTKFMSPTKTPEYLAAGRPVVSTAIPDVAQDYREEALMAHSHEEFLEHCTRALMDGIGPAAKPPQSRTWRETAEEMRRLIIEKLG